MKWTVRIPQRLPPFFFSLLHPRSPHSVPFTRAASLTCLICGTDSRGGLSSGGPPPPSPPLGSRKRPRDYRNSQYPAVSAEGIPKASPPAGRRHWRAGMAGAGTGRPTSLEQIAVREFDCGPYRRDRGVASGQRARRAGTRALRRIPPSSPHLLPPSVCSTQRRLAARAANERHTGTQTLLTRCAATPVLPPSVLP